MGGGNKGIHQRSPGIRTALHHSPKPLIMALGSIEQMGQFQLPVANRGDDKDKRIVFSHIAYGQQLIGSFGSYYHRTIDGMYLYSVHLPSSLHHLVEHAPCSFHKGTKKSPEGRLLWLSQLD